MKPILIGGTGRSGTTILKRILASHSRVVALPGELRVIVDPGGALDLINALSDRWSPYSSDHAINSFRQLILECCRGRSPLAIKLEKIEKGVFRKVGIAPRRYLGLGFGNYFGGDFVRQRLEQMIHELCYGRMLGSWAGSPPYQLRSKIYECGPVPRHAVEKAVQEFFQDLYGQMAKKRQTHWLDDTPANVLYADELLSLFPEVKIIHIYRDPRDVLASYRQFSWGGENVSSISKRLSGIYCRWLESRERLPHECYLEIGLEALSRHPQESLRRICDFIGLSFEEDLLGVPLDRVHAGRWMSDLSEDEKLELEIHLAPIIEIYGY